MNSLLRTSTIWLENERWWWWFEIICYARGFRSYITLQRWKRKKCFSFVTTKLMSESIYVLLFSAALFLHVHFLLSMLRCERPQQAFCSAKKTRSCNHLFRFFSLNAFRSLQSHIISTRCWNDICRSFSTAIALGASKFQTYKILFTKLLLFEFALELCSYINVMIFMTLITEKFSQKFSLESVWVGWKANTLTAIS